jgi:3-deoxy-D-manno-octulosonic-acid transferase
MAGAACLYFPLDYPWVVHQVISRLQPRLFLMVETEIWPNFLRELTRQAIPAILVNGRISRVHFAAIGVCGPSCAASYQRSRASACRPG